jgi:hypothetical protein
MGRCLLLAATARAPLAQPVVEVRRDAVSGCGAAAWRGLCCVARGSRTRA